MDGHARALQLSCQSKNITILFSKRGSVFVTVQKLQDMKYKNHGGEVAVFALQKQNVIRQGSSEVRPKPQIMQDSCRGLSFRVGVLSHTPTHWRPCLGQARASCQCPCRHHRAS